MKGRVTGIGGDFFKVRDSHKTKKMVSGAFGLNTDQYVPLFGNGNQRTNTCQKKAFTQWFPQWTQKTEYF